MTRVHWSTAAVAAIAVAMLAVCALGGRRESQGPCGCPVCVVER